MLNVSTIPRPPDLAESWFLTTDRRDPSGSGGGLQERPSAQGLQRRMDGATSVRPRCSQWTHGTSPAGRLRCRDQGSATVRTRRVQARNDALRSAARDVLRSAARSPHRGTADRIRRASWPVRLAPIEPRPASTDVHERGHHDTRFSVSPLRGPAMSIPSANYGLRRGHEVELFLQVRDQRETTVVWDRRSEAEADGSRPQTRGGEIAPGPGACWWRMAACASGDAGRPGTLRARGADQGLDGRDAEARGSGFVLSPNRGEHHVCHDRAVRRDSDPPLQR